MSKLLHILYFTILTNHFETNAMELSKIPGEQPKLSKELIQELTTISDESILGEMNKYISYDIGKLIKDLAPKEKNK